MYDTLEGLDYKPGECAYYVGIILNNLTTALENGEAVYKERDHVQVGDVCVDDYSSHLITRPFDQYRIRTRREKEKLLVIPKEVLEEKKRNFRDCTQKD